MQLVYYVNFLILAYLPFSFSDVLSLTNLSPGLFAINLSIGYPQHTFLLLIDTTSDYTWVRGTNCTFCSYLENIYDEKSSISVIYPTGIPFTTITDIRGSVAGEIAFDDIKLGELYASKLEFLIASEDEFLDLADGVLGLDTMNKAGSNNNLLNKLFQNGQIKHRIFSINLKEEMAATLTIGEIPQHILDDTHNYSTCKVRTTNKANWNCYVTHVLFGDDYNFYNAIPLGNVVVNFATGVSNIYLPQNYIDLFLNNYFKLLPGYNNRNCLIKKSSKTKNILCLKKFLNFNGPSINFILNGYAYQIPFEDLFEDIFSDSYNQYSVFKIDFTETPGNEWYFGTVFMKQHEIVFDGEKMQVGFYSGFKYDFTKLTNENVEEYCLYNTFTYVFLFSIIVLPMIYTIVKKKMSKDHLTDIARRAYKRL